MGKAANLTAERIVDAAKRVLGIVRGGQLVSRKLELAVKYGRPNRDATATNGRCDLLLEL